MYRAETPASVHYFYIFSESIEVWQEKNLFSWFSWYFSSQCLLVGAINLILCFPVVLSTSLLTPQLSKFIFLCYCTLNLAVVCFFFFNCYFIPHSFSSSTDLWNSCLWFLGVVSIKRREICVLCKINIWESLKRKPIGEE